MSLKKDIKRNAKSISLKLEKLSDAFDKKYLRFNNRDLVLLESDNRLEVAVIATAKTRRWIKNHFAEEVNSYYYNQYAITLSGEHKILDVKTEMSAKKKPYIQYYYRGKEVSALCDYAENSQRLFWTIRKLKCLDKYQQNEQLDIVNLFCLQDKIDEELGLITIKKDDTLDM